MSERTWLHYSLALNAQLFRNLCAIRFVEKLSDSETTLRAARKFSSATDGSSMRSFCDFDALIVATLRF